MCHDRNDGDEIALAHEFIAVMIGAQRSGVTVALHILEGTGMIRSKRGRVIIRDRGKLEERQYDGLAVWMGESTALPAATSRLAFGAARGGRRAGGADAGSRARRRGQSRVGAAVRYPTRSHIRRIWLGAIPGGSDRASFAS